MKTKLPVVFKNVRKNSDLSFYVIFTETRTTTNPFNTLNFFLNISFLLSLLYFSQEANSQVNIMGKPGYINIPSADWYEEQPLGFSFNHLPGPYNMYGNEKTGVNFYNVRATFTSFFEVNLSLAHRPGRARINNLGVGDRQFDFRVRLLSEKEYFPAIVIGLTPPGIEAPYLSHDYLVASKNIKSGFGNFTFSGGYGFPYVLRRREEAEFYFHVYFSKKSILIQNNYLSGFFGGVSYKPFDFGGLLFEYDSNTFNAGAFIKPFNWLILQGTTYEGKEWGFSAAFNFSLDHSPYSLKNYEKDLD